MLSIKNAIYLMLEVYPEVSELNEFEKIIKHSKFASAREKKQAKVDYENILALREEIRSHFSKEEKDYEWLNHTSNVQLVEMIKSPELLRSIIIFMNQREQNLVEE